MNLGPFLLGGLVLGGIGFYGYIWREAARTCAKELRLNPLDYRGRKETFAKAGLMRLGVIALANQERLRCATKEELAEANARWSKIVQGFAFISRWKQEIPHWENTSWRIVDFRA